MNYYLIYTSYSTTALSDIELLDLLKVSQSNNQNYNITGMLYYYQGSFIQLLEGEKTKVMLIYEKICSDKRHYSVVILKEGFVNNRFFPEWTMGFKRLSTTDYQREAGGKSQDGVIDVKSVLYLFRILN